MKIVENSKSAKDREYSIYIGTKNVVENIHWDQKWGEEAWIEIESWEAWCFYYWTLEIL